jgi:hypothetical protein
VFLYRDVSEVYVRVVHVFAVVSVLRIAESGESMGISCAVQGGKGRENKVMQWNGMELRGLREAVEWAEQYRRYRVKRRTEETVRGTRVRSQGTYW